jgi:uncharacterized protein
MAAPSMQPERVRSPGGKVAYLLLMSGIAVAVTLGYGILQSRSVLLERIAVFGRHLPRNAKGFMILQVSDLHSGGSLKVEARVAGMLERISAGMMVMTGDFGEEGGPVGPAIEGVHVLVRPVIGRMPVYAVQGHTDSPAMMQALRDEGVRVVDNAAVPILEGLWLVGWNPYREPHPTVLDIVRSIPQGAAIILAAHSPEVMLTAGSDRATLVLTGHTHGGQIRFPFVRPLMLLTRLGPSYFRGLHRLDQSLLYINRGIGTTTIPLRVYSPPEVTLLTLK